MEFRNFGEALMNIDKALKKTKPRKIKPRETEGNKMEIIINKGPVQNESKINIITMKKGPTLEEMREMLKEELNKNELFGPRPRFLPLKRKKPTELPSVYKTTTPLDMSSLTGEKGETLELFRLSKIDDRYKEALKISRKKERKLIQIYKKENNRNKLEN